MWKRTTERTFEDSRSTYKRHGTLNLFAALEVAAGAIHAETKKLKRRVEFLEFMDRVMAELPVGREVNGSQLKNTIVNLRN